MKDSVGHRREEDIQVLREIYLNLKICDDFYLDSKVCMKS